MKASILIGIVIISGFLMAGCPNTMPETDCGTNLTCFMESAQNCSPAKVNATFDLSFGGTAGNLNVVELLEVVGGTIDNCQFRGTFYKFDASGTSNAAMEQSLSTAMIGKQVICQLPAPQNETGEITSEKLAGDMLQSMFTPKCSGSAIDIMRPFVPQNISSEATLSSCKMAAQNCKLQLTTGGTCDIETCRSACYNSEGDVSTSGIMCCMAGLPEEIYKNANGRACTE